MNYSSLGKSDIKISEIGFGSMSLELDQEKATSLLRRSHEHGINFFDTADLYDKGLNEEMVGKALKPIRDEVVISTKVGNVWNEDGSGWEWNPTKKHILSGVEESLHRLQTNIIDVYMLHGGTIEDPIDEIIEAFEQLKRQGKIRAYGISSIRPNVIREYIKRSNIDCVMMQYSLLDRRPEESCLNLLAEHNISVLTRGSLARGLLLDKPAKEYLGYSKAKVQQMQTATCETGNPVGASLQYVLQHPAVTSAVVGIRTKDQLDDILQHYGESIPSDTLQKMASILAPKVYDKHR
ncbi:MAG: aldo/keto reductase [Balneolaceae bacterium]